MLFAEQFNALVEFIQLLTEADTFALSKYAFLQLMRQDPFSTACILNTCVNLMFISFCLYLIVRGDNYFDTVSLGRDFQWNTQKWFLAEKEIYNE